LKGGFYHNSDRIENSGFHLRIVGETPDPSDVLGGNPAVLQMVSRDDGTVDGRLITGLGSMTLKNLYIPGALETGDQTSYEPITTQASNSRFNIENVIFERSNFSMMSFYGTDNDIFFKNCTFRNLIGEPSGQQWEGRGASVWANQDTVVVENCTFFNVGMTAFQLEGGSANFVLFVHNTLVNVGRSIHSGNWWQEAYFANNLLINTFWHGEGFADLNSAGRDPRNTFGGMFSIGELPAVYGPEEGRRIVLANTASWRDPEFAAFYADTIQAQYYANPIAQEDFFDVYEQIVAVDTLWLENRPNIGTYPSELIPEMIQNINDLRRGQLPANPYFWMLPEFEGEPCHVCVSWPLPENFTYDDSNLLTAGTDGLPLGDLNWFPTQKAEWEANRDAHIAEIKALAGQERRLTIVATAEAEGGTLAGDAAVVDYDGPIPYFDMDGGGFIRWVFNMPEAATVKMVITTRSQDARRGEHVRVNGTGLLNNAGFGEYSWYDLHPTEWKAYTITTDTLVNGTDAALNLQAGENTIELAPSWGYQEFQSVDVLVGETLIVSLNALNVTEYEIVALVSPGGPPPPSGFRTVAMGANGSVAFAFDAPADGNYLLNVFYQAPGGTQTADVWVDGQTVGSATLEAEVGDSSIVGGLSTVFPMTAGSHSVAISGGNYSVDFVQLVKEDIILSVSGPEILPEGYVLGQNYPNPFNPSTNIRFSLGKASKVKLSVFNLLGQKVATLIDGNLVAGPYSIQFEAQNLSSGVYFYRLEAGDVVMSKRMLLLK
jgi:hypothetical protein